jgi:hypothetical protein
MWVFTPVALDFECSKAMVRFGMSVSRKGNVLTQGNCNYTWKLLWVPKNEQGVQLVSNGEVK